MNRSLRSRISGSARMLWLCFGCYTSVTAYTTQGISLKFPPTLAPFAFEAISEHRFYGSIVDTPVNQALFGLGTGAVANAELNFLIWKGLSADIMWQFSSRELSIGAGYTFAFLQKIISAFFGAEFHNGGSMQRTSSYHILAALSTLPLAGRITPVLNAGFDGELRRAGAGIGTAVSINDRCEVVAEIVPFVYRKNSVPVYSAGTVLKTFRHHFVFFVSNSRALGSRGNLSGATDVYPRFGFSLKRLFDFP